MRWQAQDEEGAVLRDQLKQAAHLWEEKGRPDDLLWTGTSEREFELWHDRYPGKLTALEEQYSKAMVDRTRKRKRVRRAATVALVVGLAAVAAAIGVSRQQAVEQARRAEAAQLLTLAETRLEDDPTEALAYATAGIELADSAAARELVLRALSEAPPALELPVNVTNAARVPTFSPDGEWLAAAGFVGDALVWKANGQGPMPLGGHVSDPSCGNEAHWTGLGFLVTGLACGQAEQLYVWSLPDGQRLRTIDLERPSFWQVGQEHVFTESEDADAPHRVRLHSWHLASGEGRALGRVDLEALGVTATVTTPVSAGERSGGVLDPEGHGWVYGRGSDILVKALPVDGHLPDRRLLRHRSEVRSLGAFRRATDGVYSRDDSGEVRLFDSSRAAVGDEGVVQVPADAPEDVRPGPSGRWVVGPVGKEGEARLWDPQTLPGSRPWRLRRSGTWFVPEHDVHPSGDWLVVSMHGGWTALTFWPLKRPAPVVVDGYVGVDRPVAFTADSRVLVTSWADGTLRLWTVPGQGPPQVRSLPRGDGREPVGRPTLVLDPHDRFAFVVGHAGHAFIVPLDGEPARRLEGFSAQTLLGNPPAVSPSGRFVAAISFFGGEKTLWIWDLESGKTRALAPPQPPPASVEAGSLGETGFEGRLGSLAFLDDSTLLTGGDGGVRRWDLETGSHEVLVPAEWGVLLYGVVSNDKSTMITQGLAPNKDETWVRRHHEALRPRLVDLGGGGSRALPDVGGHFWVKALDPTGKVMVTVGTIDGVLRVGRTSGSGPSHVLAGHEGEVQYAAISPDGRWVATSGQDNTLRLWPMPNLDRPPLHSLPHDELLSKLKSLTNLRAVRSPESATGWTIELGPFPGWKDVPTW